MIYGVLYDSMLVWYDRRNVRSQYLDFYAITSLVAMEFVNFLTLITFLAYLNIGPAREFFHSGASGGISVLTAVLLLVINYVYLIFRRRSQKEKVRAGARLYWIASVYMVGSVVVAIYASTLVSAFKK